MLFMLAMAACWASLGEAAIPSTVRNAFIADITDTWQLVETARGSYPCPNTVQHTTWRRSDGVVIVPHNAILHDGVRCESTGAMRTLQIYQSRDVGEDLSSGGLPERAAQVLRSSGPNRDIRAGGNETGGNYLIGWEPVARVCGDAGTVFTNGTTLFVFRPFRTVTVMGMETSLVRGARYMLVVPRFQNVICVYSNTVPVPSPSSSPMDGDSQVDEEEEEEEEDDEDVMSTPLPPVSSPFPSVSSLPSLSPARTPPPASESPIQETLEPPFSSTPESPFSASPSSSASVPSPVESEEDDGDFIPVITVGEDEDDDEEEDDDGLGPVLPPVVPESPDVSEEPETDDGPEVSADETLDVVGEDEDSSGESEEDSDDNGLFPDEGVDDEDSADETVEPSPDDDAVCFPGDVSVMLADGSQIAMHKLRVGDFVRVSEGQSARVYGFSHWDPTASAHFITLRTESGHTLTATLDHYIPVITQSSRGQQVMSRMRHIVPGDHITLLLPRSGSRSSPAEVTLDAEDTSGVRYSRSKVVAVEQRYRRGAGLFNPQTSHGSLVVNRVLATTWTASVQPQFAHAALVPFRALAALFHVDILHASLNTGLRCLAPFVPKSVS